MREAELRPLREILKGGFSLQCLEFSSMDLSAQCEGVVSVLT